MEEEVAPIHGDVHENEPVVEFGDNKSFNLPLFLVWFSFIVSIVFLGSLWFLKMGFDSQIKTKQNERSELKARLNTQEYVDIEKKAEAVQVAVNTLSAISGTRIKTKDFLDELYKKVTNDVKLTSISLGADGSINFEGATSSYKNVADFMLGIKSYDRISKLQLMSVSASSDTSVKSNEKIIFTVSGMADLSKSQSSSE